MGSSVPSEFAAMRLMVPAWADPYLSRLLCRIRRTRLTGRAFEVEFALL